MGLALRRLSRLSVPSPTLRCVLTRAQVLAYRVAVHHLEHPVGEGVLPAGVQDVPIGETASQALRARELTADAAALVHAQTVRATAHVHRARDLPLFAAALGALQITDLTREHFGPFDEETDLPGALAHVALAMRRIFADGQPRSKADLSESLTPLVDPRLAPWCPNCRTHHVQDSLFRYATLQANLIMQVSSYHRFEYAPLPGGFGPPLDPETSQTTLARVFLRLCGPSRPEHLARWLALRPAAARRIWKRLEVVPVSVDDRPCWMHPEDLAVLEAAEPTTGVHLLPPHDPLVELADRYLLLPSRPHRAAVWRPVSSPGVLLIRGEIAGTWRHRTSPRRLTVTVKSFGPLSGVDRRIVSQQAKTLAGHPELQVQAKFEEVG